MRYKILIDASCILAALGSARGGSSKLFSLLRKSQHRLFVSEISIEESRRHLKFLKCTKRDLSVLLAKYVDEVLVAPTLKEIRDCKNIFSDEEDLYLIATSRKIDAHYLVSLDKKHVLSQAKKIKRPKILSPGEFIKILDR